MKKIMFVGLFFLALSAGALAQPSGEKKEGSSVQGMTQETMKGEQSSQGSMEGMGGMRGMMRMMKMMDQCAAMMEKCCSPTESDKAKEGPKE